MNKIFVFISLIILLCINSSCLYCSEIDSTLNDVQHNIPEWFRRVYYGIEVGSENKPRIFFETIQPIWENKLEDSLFFVQPYYSIQNDIKEYSLGLGYRHLLENKKVFLGINSFFDYQQNNEHYQLGLGLEAIGDIASARINTYMALSGKELILDTLTYKEYEKALNGLDAEIGFPIPYLSCAKIFGLGYYYNADHMSDIYGWKTRLEIKPFLWMTIDLGAQDDNHREQEWFAKLEMHLPLDRELNVRRIPASNRLLDLVERNFSPTTETWQEEKKAIISGYLTNQRNLPLSNAKVEIHSDIVTTHTNTTGYFSVAVIPGNHIMYIYNSDNRLLHSQQINAKNDMRIDVSQIIHDPALDTSPPVDTSPPPDTSPPNSAPSINQLTAIASSITYPTTSEISFNVNDPDKDNINWTANISGGPNKGSLSNSSGTVGGGEGNVVIIYTPENTDGSFTIHIHLNDGHGNEISDTVVVTVTSSSLNNSPQISNLSADPNPIENPPHKTYITFDVEDTDGDDVSWTASITAGPSPEGNVIPSGGTVHNGSGGVSTKYQPVGGTPDGTFTITIELDDGNGGTDTESINIVLDRD